MEDYIHEIKVDNNPIMAFVDSQLNMSDKSRAITKAGLYKAFRQWAKDHGHHAPSFRKFNRRFSTTYKMKTDQQMTTGDREKIWSGISYSSSDNCIENGQKEMAFSE